MTNAIARLRLRRGWTQQQLAAIVRVSRQTIVAIEKGNYEPSTSLSLKLALAFGVSVEALFALTPEAIATVHTALRDAVPPDTDQATEKEQAR